ncbi:MAG: TonB-dependent receptor [Flavobacteriales bacterium]|nr:TonB-dependent receptor [Flavobacteriales bacterium]
MKFKVCSTLIGILLVSEISAQVLLRGVVIDERNSDPLRFVELFETRSGEMQLTNKSGQFEFAVSPDMDHVFLVSMNGYESRQIRIRTSRDTSLVIELSSISSDLSEVVIQQKRENDFALRQLKPVQGTAIYAGKKSEVVLMDLKVGNLASNNARQIYSQVVGLNIYDNGDAGLQLNIGGRGLDPNRTANFNTRQNGYDISADVLGYPESYYTPPAEALEEIQIVRGAASLQYGTQFGGLINFRFREPSASSAIEWTSRQTLGSYGLFTSFNALSGTLGKWSYSTWFNYKQGDGFRPNSAFSSHNTYGMLRYTPNIRTNIRAEFTHLSYLAQQAGGLTDSQFEKDPFFSNRNRNWFHVDWKLYALRLEHRISSRTTFSLNGHLLDAGRDALGFRGDPKRPERNPIVEPDDPSYERDLIRGTFNNWSTEARLVHRYLFLGCRSTALIGAKYYSARNSSIQGPGSNGSDADFEFRFNTYPSYPNQSDFSFPNRNMALFGEQIIRLSEKWSVTPGLRWEYIRTQSEGSYAVVRFDNAGNEIFRQDTTDNRDLERKFVLAGIGSSYNLNRSVEAYGNLSQNYRSVTFSDIRVVNPTFLIDPNIQDESGYTLDLGIRGRINKRVTFDFSAYSMRYNDRIGTILVEEGPNKGDRLRKNIGDARITGLETFADIKLLATQGDSARFKLNVFGNFALTHSEYIESEENNVSGRRVEFVPLLNLKTGLRFGYRNITGSLQYTYLSQQFTDAENTAITWEGDSREGIVGEIPAYSVWDLSLAYKWKQLRFESGINNLLNRSYFTRRASGYPGPGIIPSEPRSGYFTLGWILSYPKKS